MVKNILVAGTEQDVAHCRLKFGQNFECIRVLPGEIPADPQAVLFIDFHPPETGEYTPIPRIPILVDTVFRNLEQLGIPLTSPVFGFNGWPGMICGECLEVSSRIPEDTRLSDLASLLNSPFVQVADQVGLVTPRVISMIINEAWFALQEGVATREEIDVALKLGTNYPYGPFEWQEKLGVTRVVRLLEALELGTGDSRYFVAESLKKEASKERPSEIKSDI